MSAVQSMLAKVEKTAVNNAIPAPTKPTPPASTDRYPNSQAINVDDVTIPNVGLPISRQAYTTLDSVDDVMTYYRKLYPSATVTEQQGQKVIAFDNGSDSRVITVGNNGSETRIVIVKLQ